MEMVIMDIILKALPYIINILSGCILAVATYNINKARTDKQEQDRKQQALEDGVQCLLRNSIVTDYNKYTNKGYCPIYAKETLKKTYQAYSNLGGNDVAKELYHKLLQMPSEVENG
jgi:hypothetical protein